MAVEKNMSQSDLEAEKDISSIGSGDSSRRRRRRRRRTRDGKATAFDAARISNTDETDSCRGALAIDGDLVYSSLRTLTCTTYLRRLQLSMSDAAGLFPEVRKTMDHVFAKTSKKRRTASGYFKAAIDVCIQDVQGRRWPVNLELLRTARQQHVRLSKGWTDVCRANGISLSTSVRCRAVDIGANMGTMTMAMLQMKASVIAVEPQSDLCESTSATVACASMSAQATVHCAAIASTADKASGKTEIVLDTSQLFRFGQPVASKQTTVPLLRLEDVVPPAAYRIFKVDTDAIDCDILAQLARMIKAGTHNMSSMVFESNSCSLQAGQVLHEFQGMGYTVYRTMLRERTFDGVGGQASPLAIDNMPAYAVERFNLRYNRYVWELKPMSKSQWQALAGAKVWQYLVTKDDMASSPLEIAEKT